MKRFAVALVAVSAMLVGTLGTNAEAASRAIRPNQHFIGLVNGQHTDAVIYTICPGPMGGTGPPAANQTVAVHRVRAGGGDTGSGGGVIYARITPTVVVTLTHYQQPGTIPMSAEVPCEGLGRVVFSSCPLPGPCGAGAAVDEVPVTFVDIAA